MGITASQPLSLVTLATEARGNSARSMMQTDTRHWTRNYPINLTTSDNISHFHF